jgi:hypothetical protein
MRLQYNRAWHDGFIGILASAGGPTTFELEAIHTPSKSRHIFTACADVFNGRAYFNSYCLADGEYELIPSIHHGEGDAAESLRCSVEIRNGTSPLAQALRHEASIRSQAALVMNGLDSSYFSDYPPPLNHKDYAQFVRHRRVRRRLSDEALTLYDRQGFLQLPSFLEEDLIGPARQALAEVNTTESHGFQKGSSQRFVNLHESIPALATLYSCPKLYDVASDLFGYQAYPCQSLSFIHGSGQGPHQDTIHLTPFPRGLMCGIWIALEDVVPDSGELFYYPGSHRLEAVLCHSHGVAKLDLQTGNRNEFATAYRPAIAALLAANPQLVRQTFMAKAGDVLIWHENLIHGGSPRVRPEPSRMSMVIHTFAEAAYLYFDASGTLGRRDWPFPHSPPGRPAAAAAGEG